tara:strand:+ start:247 stop:489 length:243 start_codon:yes stop_codon:yes gene_type:complete
LNLHGLFAAVYLAFAALGAEHAAAADFTGVSLAELVGHLAALRGIYLGYFYLSSMGVWQQAMAPSPPLVTMNSEPHLLHT